MSKGYREHYSRVTKVLDSVPGIWRDFRIEKNLNDKAEVVLVWGHIGRGYVSCSRMTRKEAEKVTNMELDTLAIELTFGVGVG